MLVVKGGTVVTASGEFLADVQVDGERIVAIDAGLRVGNDAEVIDARGCYVLPGVIDGHVHFREPGLEHKEDWQSGSRAAVFGGVTTVLEMPNTMPATATAAEVERKRGLAEGRSYSDFGLFGLFSLEDLAGMAEAGVVGFKCFLGPTTGDLPPPDDGTLLEALAVAASLGLRVAFHCENDAIVRRTAEQGQGRPIIAEVEAIQRIALFARETGARIHVCHLSSRDGLAMVEHWRGRGVDITCEVTPHHCFLTDNELTRVGGLAKINPPLRERGNGDALLDGLRRGAVDYVATDHSPHLPSEKLRENLWEAVSGFAGVETSLRLFLTYGALTMPQLVRAMCEAPARVWGLYPRKGALEVGSDADLVVLDATAEGTIEAERLHGKNNLSPWIGWRTRGHVMATVVRGKVVVRENELAAEPSGRMVAFKNPRGGIGT